MKTVMIENTSTEELINELENLIQVAIKSIQKKENNSTAKILTRKETSELLKVSLVTLHKWNKLGVLPSYSVGNRVYYKWLDVENAMKRVA
ncbi:helix-turn-helix domain-containing protein [Leeuwenhoekiella parthenopeia]|uniref:Helix-turn-helix domain-containing protein n=1 Tax=Leeuwenhoekiella parthenopeia TaxID=2890320 RepID=A0ABS8GYD6_9FLAO|nr:helix-turn-helix domain-containing protein [Leeuwenhoekiella parthenopeia]MCC4214096.1 helix-turn-helix domain-containing protein [Leeuwenhoekiella parthenopeia]